MNIKFCFMLTKQQLNSQLNSTTRQLMAQCVDICAVRHLNIAGQFLFSLLQEGFILTSIYCPSHKPTRSTSQFSFELRFAANCDSSSVGCTRVSVNKTQSFLSWSRLILQSGTSEFYQDKRYGSKLFSLTSCPNQRDGSNVFLPL